MCFTCKNQCTIVIFIELLLLMAVKAKHGVPYRACACPTMLAPVCAIDGNTYTNLCILRCARRSSVRYDNIYKRVIVPGVCPKLKCECDLTINHVCGTDQFTYINECYLDCYREWLNEFTTTTIAVAYADKCRRIDLCTQELIPVCGTDSKTYKNLCFLHYASQQNTRNDLNPVYLKHWGECMSERCLCPLVWSPVCANDGKEYNNYCEFKCEKRKRNQLDTVLKIVNKGPCKNCICTAIFDPVCASNEQSFANPCLLECENYKRRRQGLPLIHVVSEGSCKCVCPNVEDPVCGTDGNTYKNPCEFNCENKARQLEGLPLLLELNLGDCAECVCPRYTDPICSSDGRSFSNSCYLECENRRREQFGLFSLTYKRGPCPHIFNDPN